MGCDGGGLYTFMEKSKKRNLSTSELYIKHSLGNQNSFLFDKLQSNVEKSYHCMGQTIFFLI